MSEPPRVPSLPYEELKAALGSEATDDTAQQEASLLARGLPEKDIRRIAEESEHLRSERFRDHFEKIAVVALWVAAISLLTLILVWLAHIVLPDCWHWLTPDQIAKVQNLVTGGVVASLVSGHLRKRIGA